MMTTAVVTKEDLIPMVRDIVAEIAEIDADEIQNDTDFVKDLELDSMMALEILAIIEKRLCIEIDEDYLVRMTSINNLLGVLDELL